MSDDADDDVVALAYLPEVYPVVSLPAHKIDKGG